MIVNYLREDKDGNPVRVEIWRDEAGRFVRIKRIIYGTITYRSDLYVEDNLKRFEEALQEEIASLMDYQKALKDVLQPMAEFVQNNPEPNQAALQRLQNTVLLLTRGK